MSTWTVLAAKHAAVASGLAAGWVPALGTGSVDGFLAGALMTGACCAVLSSPGRARLRHRAVAMAGLGAGLGEGRRRRASDAAPPETPAQHDPGQHDEAAGPPAPEGPGGYAPEEPGGYRSRHRLTGDAPKPPEPRRNGPRHAAPPVSFSSRLSSRLGGRLAFRALTPARH